MTSAPKKVGRLRQMRVVRIRPRGEPREPPPEPPKRSPGSELSAFPAVPVLFSSFGLSPDILQALDAIGYRQATDVQAQAIPRRAPDAI